jgi:hypothetical protein
MPDGQNTIGSFVRNPGKMHSLLGVQECQARLFDEDTPGIREFHKPSLIATEKPELMPFFEVGNLFAESRLRDVQSVRGPREVPLFSQDNDCLQMPNFDLGEHFAPPGG